MYSYITITQKKVYRAFGKPLEIIIYSRYFNYPKIRYYDVFDYPYEFLSFYEMRHSFV